MKRITVLLTADAHEELKGICYKHRRSITAIARLGIGLVKIALAASNNGQRVIIVAADGTPLKEVVI